MILTVTLMDWPSSTDEDGWTLARLMTGRDCPARRMSVRTWTDRTATASRNRMAKPWALGSFKISSHGSG